MPVNSTHPAYDLNLETWQRIRDVIAGDAAIKRGGEKYMPRLDSQSDAEYQAYIGRGFFYNATARTVSGYLGLIFRKDPIFELPNKSAALHPALKAFVNDVDLVGTTLDDYSKNTVSEVIALGRIGTLVDWHQPENRAYLTAYPAESIFNWRERRINGKLKLSLVVLSETANGESGDPFEIKLIPQIRVLKLSDGSSPVYQVEIWQLVPKEGNDKEREWKLIQSLTPLRLGKPLDGIPFVFHGASNSRPNIEKPPVEDIVAANLDHYRLNTDYKHGMHFTALPTAFVTGFDKGTQLRIGSTTAWVTETVGATAQYLEFQGDGLMSFERAMDRTERLMTSLGSRLLQGEQTFAQTAEAMTVRAKGEESVIGGIAKSVSDSINQLLCWVAWWHSSKESPWDFSEGDFAYKLNRDFDFEGLSANDLSALVSAWQSGGISRDTLLHNLRVKELLPPGRTEEEEVRLIGSETGNRRNGETGMQN